MSKKRKVSYKTYQKRKEDVFDYKDKLDELAIELDIANSQVERSERAVKVLTRLNKELVAKLDMANKIKAGAEIRRQEARVELKEWRQAYDELWVEYENVVDSYKALREIFSKSEFNIEALEPFEIKLPIDESINNYEE